MSFEELEKQIENIKDEFYSENGGKNIFFKKSQKYECANTITSKIPLEVLLENTCVIFENTNCVHINYPILKTFAAPENFDRIADFIICKFNSVKTQYSEFEIMLNFDGFTVSSAERYRRLIEIFCQKCFQENTCFSIAATRFLVYNAPTMIESIKPIVFPLMEEEMKRKLVVVQKKHSVEIVERVSVLKPAKTSSIL